MKLLNFPNRVTVELTNRCNVSCTFCHRQVYDMKMGDMSAELYYKIIDEMAEHRPIKLVPFFRGESVLHPEFIDFMIYAKNKGIGPIQLFSNGLAFDHKIAEAIIKAGVDFVSFSLDTLDDTIYKNSRISGDLSISMKHVREFCLLCQEYRKKGAAVPEIQVSTVDLAVYKEGQQDFIDYWKKYADIVRIYEEHDENGGFVDPEVSKKLAFLSERKPCRKLYTDMIIYWNGEIALCNYDWHNQLSIGDVNIQSMEEIWMSAQYNEIRKMHEENRIKDSLICSKCEHWKADYLENHYLGKAIRGLSKEE